MGYEDRRVKATGNICEQRATEFLRNSGFSVVHPIGRDMGVDCVITSREWPGMAASVQIKGRRQVKNPRWFCVSIAASRVRDAKQRGKNLNELWREQIRMVEFWIMVSVPMNEIWVLPSDKVIEIARFNEPHYRTRLDNQFDKPHYDNKGRIAKKQKELNLDIVSDGIPLWSRFCEFRNNVDALRRHFAAKSLATK